MSVDGIHSIITQSLDIIHEESYSTDDNMYNMDSHMNDVMYLASHPLGIGFIDNIYNDIKIPFLDSIIDSMIHMFQTIFVSNTPKKNILQHINFNDELYYHPLNM